MVKYHSDSEKGNLLPPHVLLFPISTGWKGKLLNGCTMGGGGIDPNTHRTISGRCHEDSWLEDYPRYSVMVDPLSYFLFNPVLHDWCNKGRDMCYPVCGMMHIK